MTNFFETERISIETNYLYLPDFIIGLPFKTLVKADGEAIQRDVCLPSSIRGGEDKELIHERFENIPWHNYEFESIPRVRDHQLEDYDLSTIEDEDKEQIRRGGFIKDTNKEGVSSYHQNLIPECDAQIATFLEEEYPSRLIQASILEEQMLAILGQLLDLTEPGLAEALDEALEAGDLSKIPNEYFEKSSLNSPQESPTTSMGAAQTLLNQIIVLKRIPYDSFPSCALLLADERNSPNFLFEKYFEVTGSLEWLIYTGYVKYSFLGQMLDETTKNQPSRNPLGDDYKIWKKSSLLIGLELIYGYCLNIGHLYFGHPPFEKDTRELNKIIRNLKETIWNAYHQAPPNLLPPILKKPLTSSLEVILDYQNFYSQEFLLCCNPLWRFDRRGKAIAVEGEEDVLRFFFIFPEDIPLPLEFEINHVQGIEKLGFSREVLNDNDSMREPLLISEIPLENGYIGNFVGRIFYLKIRKTAYYQKLKMSWDSIINANRPSDISIEITKRYGLNDFPILDISYHHEFISVGDISYEGSAGEIFPDVPGSDTPEPKPLEVDSLNVGEIQGDYKELIESKMKGRSDLFDFNLSDIQQAQVTRGGVSINNTNTVN